MHTDGTNYRKCHNWIGKIHISILWHKDDAVTFSVIGSICVHVPMSLRARTYAPDAWYRIKVTEICGDWVPGDEHVFSVVVIVLARSPDCNLRSLVILGVPAALLHYAVSDLCALHLLGILWTVKVSAV